MTPVIAAALDASFPGAWARVRRFMEGRSIPRKVRELSETSERWVDIGCGNGYLAELFAPHAYLGLDIDRRRVALAAKLHPDHTFRRLDATTELGTLGALQGVLMVHLLHHLSNDEVERLGEQIHRQASATSRVLICEPFPATPERRLIHRTMLALETGRHHRTPDVAARMLGLRVICDGPDVGSRLYDAYWMLCAV